MHSDDLPRTPFERLCMALCFGCFVALGAMTAYMVGWI